MTSEHELDEESDAHGIWGPDGTYFIALHLGFERAQAATLAEALSHHELLHLHRPGWEDSWEEWMEPLDPEDYEHEDKRQHFIVYSATADEIDDAWRTARLVVRDVEGAVSSARAFYTSTSMAEWSEMSRDERFRFLLDDDGFVGDQHEIPELAAVTRRYFSVPEHSIALHVARAWHEAVVAGSTVSDTQALIVALTRLRDAGVEDSYFEQVRSGQPITPVLVEAVLKAHAAGIPAEYATELLHS